MNLAQMKVALESSVTEALKKSVDPKVEVKAAYDANNGVMIVELVERRQIQDNSNSIICYNIRFTEETQVTSIIAFNRVYINDTLGVSMVNNEPVAISSKFMNDISQIIYIGMDQVYHPNKYQPVETEELSQSAKAAE